MSLLTNELEQCWLNELRREYDQLCYQFRLSLKPARLRLHDGDSILGMWLPEKRTLSLSRVLIVKHPWAVTKRVLKHEMAHQICTEVYGCAQSGHEAKFHQACAAIGLERRYWRATLQDLTLQDDQAAALDDPTTRTIDKIRKLLALGQSSNEHEAAQALGRAAKLLAAHRLEAATVVEEQGLLHLSIDTGQKIFPLHRSHICNLLERFFSLRLLLATIYDPLSNRRTQTIELFGRRQDALCGEHCYHFLEQQLEALWRKNQHRFAGNTRLMKKSYFLGVLAGFREKMEQAATPTRQREDAGAARGELMAGGAFNEAIDRFAASYFPRLRPGRSSRSIIYPETYQQAKKDGRALQLHSPITKEKATLLLPILTQKQKKTER